MPEARASRAEGRFDYLVLIGRFQPVHNGHVATIRHALSLSEKLIVICGSARQARTPRSPWSVEEREQLLRSALPEAWQSRLFVVGVSDRMYNDQQWVTEVQSLVDKVIAVDTTSLERQQQDFRIGLVGSQGRQTMAYLDLFPQWERVEAPYLPDIQASRLRQAFFDETQQAAWQSGLACLPESVAQGLEAFRQQAAFAELQAEYQFLRRYRQSWAAAPYPPTLVTTDAVVIHSGHILLVRRRARPGKGLWALPGGFVGQDERIRDAVIRELRDETRLKVPAPVLSGSIRASRVFDHPHRSLRGRAISHAFLIELLPTQDGLPRVRGGDDAERAQWFPLFEFQRMENQLFEDHFYIVNWFLGQV